LDPETRPGGIQGTDQRTGSTQVVRNAGPSQAEAGHGTNREEGGDSSERRPDAGSSPHSPKAEWRDRHMAIATERRADVSVTIGGREITFETGKLAKQADGAVVVRSG